MTTLSSAIDDLFADPHLARHALWHAGGTGSPLPVRIILRQPGRVGSFGETRLVVRFQHMTPGNRHARPRAFDPGVTRASTNGALAVDAGLRRP